MTDIRPEPSTAEKKRKCVRCYRESYYGIVFDEFEGDLFICSFCVYRRLIAVEYAGFPRWDAPIAVLKKERNCE